MPVARSPSGYESLPPGDSWENYRPWTRILHLQPGSGSARLEVTLQTEDVQRCNGYEALSYVWGDAVSENPLIRDGQPVEIKVNLDAALRSLRHPMHVRRLWVDAVCIDQDNVEEKNGQIRMMRLMYMRATKVIVWLGPKKPGVDEAFKLASQLHQVRMQLLYTPNDRMKTSPAAGHDLSPASVRDKIDPNAPAWTHLSEMLDAKWWERVWCIQEFVVSTSCTAQCGDLEIPMINLLAATPYVSYWRGKYSEHKLLWFWNDIYLTKFREPYGSENSLSPSFTKPLINILEMSRGFEATEGVDQIYALLGIAEETNPKSVVCPALTAVLSNKGIPVYSKLLKYTDYISTLLHNVSRDIDPVMKAAVTPDYKRPVELVYRDVARYLVLRHRALNVLSQVQHSPDVESFDKSGFPTWVPRWDKPILASHFGAASWFLAGRADGFQQYLSRTHHHRRYARTRILDILSLDGFRVDVVDKVTEVIAVNQIETFVFDEYFRQIFDGPIDLSDNRRTRLVEDFGTTLLAGFPFERPYGNLGLTISAGRVILPPGNNMLRAAGFVHAHLRETCGYANTNPRREVLNNMLPGDAARFQNWAKKMTHKRRVYRTRDGWLGLGPEATRPGDQVCVLLGGRVPFVLRPAQNGWLLVGETYLHDVELMTGKVANDVVKRRSRRKLETFDLL